MTAIEALEELRRRAIADRAARCRVSVQCGICCSEPLVMHPADVPKRCTRCGNRHLLVTELDAPAAVEPPAPAPAAARCRCGSTASIVAVDSVRGQMRLCAWCRRPFPEEG